MKKKELNELKQRIDSEQEFLKQDRLADGDLEGLIRDAIFADMDIEIENSSSTQKKGVGSGFLKERMRRIIYELCGPEGLGGCLCEQYSNEIKPQYKLFLEVIVALATRDPQKCILVSNAIYDLLEDRKCTQNLIDTLSQCKGLYQVEQLISNILNQHEQQQTQQHQYKEIFEEGDIQQQTQQQTQQQMQEQKNQIQDFIQQQQYLSPISSLVAKPTLSKIEKQKRREQWAWTVMQKALGFQQKVPSLQKVSSLFKVSDSLYSIFNVSDSLRGTVCPMEARHMLELMFELLKYERNFTYFWNAFEEYKQYDEEHKKTLNSTIPEDIFTKYSAGMLEMIGGILMHYTSMDSKLRHSMKLQPKGEEFPIGTMIRTFGALLTIISKSKREGEYPPMFQQCCKKIIDCMTERESRAQKILKSVCNLI